MAVKYGIDRTRSAVVLSLKCCHIQPALFDTIFPSQTSRQNSKSDPITTMRGKIALEEAFEHPEKLDAFKANKKLFPASIDAEEYAHRISSITDERLRLDDLYGVEYQILSRTAPGIQAITDKDEAEEEATRSNDWIADKIKIHRHRLGAFASISMHDPVQAADELRRCVEEYDFHGAILNDYQKAPGGRYIFYDQPKYDPFWEVCVELDVPVYLHPSAPVDEKDVAFDKLYSARKILTGPGLSFAHGVGLHLMGIVVNGVFDRFPELKIIVGHLGEGIPFDFARTNQWIQKVKWPAALSAGETVCEQDDIEYYFRKNIWITTSGHFHTPTLKYVCDSLGPDRILFSIDYPYESHKQACDWFDGEKEAIMNAVGGEEAYYKIGKENSKKLFDLYDYHDARAR